MQPNIYHFFPIIFFALLFCGCDAQIQKHTSENPLFLAASGSPIPISEAPSNVILGDLNKDGKLDLVIACSKIMTLFILEGRGDGTFKKTDQSPIILSETPDELVLQDFNKDSTLDLAIASHDSYLVRILPGDGKGTVSFAESYSVLMKEGSHPHTHALATGDFNEDGKPDLITANNADSDVAVVFGKGNGRFLQLPGFPVPVNKQPYPLALGDLNNDSHLDVAVSSTNVSIKEKPSSLLTVMLGNGKGFFRRLDASLRTPNPWYVAIGDVNGDQNPDLATTHQENNKLTILTGDGTGRFSELEESPFDLGNKAWAVTLRDINQDGFADALAAANDRLAMMLSDGKGKFHHLPVSPLQTGKGTWRFAIGDVNSDDKADIVTSNLESNDVSIFLGL